MLCISAGALLLVGAPFLAWRFMPSRPLDVWILDKTVPYADDFREHSGISWALQYGKTVNPGTGKGYGEADGYYGFRPLAGGGWEELPLPESGPAPDLIYIADTYGVYRDDYSPGGPGPPLPQGVHGSLSAYEKALIRKSLGEGNILVAEYDTAATPGNKYDRPFLQNLLGTIWKGWSGKYFIDLAKGVEVSARTIATYEEQHGGEWRFFGPGFVLVSDAERVEVLVSGEDVGRKGLKFQYAKEWAGALGPSRQISFKNWFEWVEADDGIRTVADFTLDVTEKGRAKLEGLGLPPTFPAILLDRNSQYTGWYFAGDFAEAKNARTTWKFWGIADLKRLLADDAADNNFFFHWKVYIPLMRRILADAAAARKLRVAAASGPARKILPASGQAAASAAPGGAGEPETRVKAFGQTFSVLDSSGQWKDIFIRGVNIGMAEPGKFFTQFPQEVKTYRRWLEGIADMNANAVRIYTLPPPEFYRALEIHNRENPGKALYLFQEIWPEEHPPNGDYLAEEYRASYLKEIEYGIDAVYGKANVPERKGRAHGIYTADVSRWLLGWLVGRELESEEVIATDSGNPGASYEGAYVSATSSASPTEVWLAESLDEVAKLEARRYGKLHPVAIVSWPTLDPVSHDTEWDPVYGKKNKGNDRAVVTIDHFAIAPAMKAGLFGAYHIYPNYPDFMNNEPSYDEYRDDEGTLRYGGYLKEFMKSHGKFPALVAEFGLANGSGIAHFAPDGSNHGGMGETEAGLGILRMLRAIRKEGYAGGIIFEWMDEWVKKTWTTEYLMIPYERHVLWHNVVDPEQNYGLLANDVLPPESPGARYPGTGAISSMEVSADASYFHIEIELAAEQDFSAAELLIGLDTFGRGLGEMYWPVGQLRASSGMEFLVRFSGRPEKADLLVIPSYNVASFRFASLPADTGGFERMNQLVNGQVTTRTGFFIPEKRFDASALRRGAFDEAGNLWNSDGRRISIRLPWTWINVTDPSSPRVLQDFRLNYYNPEQDKLATVKTDGFVVGALFWDQSLGRAAGSASCDPRTPYLWKGWEYAPPWRERLKKSYFIIKDSWEAAKKEDPAVR